MSQQFGPVIRNYRIIEGTPLKFMSRCVIAGSPFTKAQIGSIAYSVFDVTDGTRSSPVTGSIDKATYWFDTLQTDAGWTEDATGYNFGFTFPVSAFIATRTRGSTYCVEIRATPVSGDAFWVTNATVDVTASLSTIV